MLALGLVGPCLSSLNAADRPNAWPERSPYRPAAGPGRPSADDPGFPGAVSFNATSLVLAYHQGLALSVDPSGRGLAWRDGAAIDRHLVERRGQGRLLALADQDGRKLCLFIYDAQGRLIQLRDGAGRAFRVVYGAGGGWTALFLPNGRVLRPTGS